MSACCCSKEQTSEVRTMKPTAVGLLVLGNCLHLPPFWLPNTGTSPPATAKGEAGCTSQWGKKLWASSQCWVVTSITKSSAGWYSKAQVRTLLWELALAEPWYKRIAWTPVFSNPVYLALWRASTMLRQIF